MPRIIFIPHTLAKAGEVNSDFSQLFDKPFQVPIYENTAAITATVYSLIYSTISIASIGYIQNGDICDLVSLKTGSDVRTIVDISGCVTVTNTIIIGQFIDTINKTVAFKTSGSFVTVTIAESDGIKVIFPIHSTFENLPEDVFRREFKDSFEIVPMWIPENHSSECNGINITFVLNFIPLQNSVRVLKNGIEFSENDTNINDYSINYSTKTITMTEAPTAGSNLFIDYQYLPI